MRRTIDGETVRRKLETEYGIALPKLQCHGGWEAPIRQILDEMRVRGLLDISRVEQVKEKFGGLKIHTSPGLADYDEWKTFNRKKLKIEDTSYEICESCGQPGELRKEQMPYVTLCDTCFAEWTAE